MSEQKDPERLLADALRAQAVFAPSAAGPVRETEQRTEAVPTTQLDAPAELPSAYGLLSGASADSLERERAALDLAEAEATAAPARWSDGWHTASPCTVFGVILAESTVTTMSLLPSWLDPQHLLSGLTGPVLVALCLIIFIESSIFPVLPGDSLLFTAGLFIANGTLDAPLWLVCVLVTVAALLGNVVGYYIGYFAGPKLFNRPDSKFFKQEYVDKTHAFLEKHGPKAVVLARFVPFVRTFITWIAGIGRMDPKRYFTYTVIGGILWAAGITVLGSLLGGVDFIANNVDAIFVVIVLVSVVPIGLEYLKSRREKKAALAAADPEVTQRIPRVKD